MGYAHSHHDLAHPSFLPIFKFKGHRHGHTQQKWYNVLTELCLNILSHIKGLSYFKNWPLSLSTFFLCDLIFFGLQRFGHLSQEKKKGHPILQTFPTLIPMTTEKKHTQKKEK